MVLRSRLSAVLAALVLAIALAGPASADPVFLRERTLTCSDDTVFVGQQVRMGFGLPPHTWRNVDPNGSPSAFVFFAAAVTLPDGTVIDEVTWDHSLGVDRNHDLVTCWFTIPIGDFETATATFTGYFVP